MTNDNIKIVIVAAGKGSRFGSELPKQFCDLMGRPLLMTTISRAAEVVGLDNILLVLSEESKPLWGELCAKHRFVSPAVTLGGASRVDSVRNALAHIASCGAPDDTIVMIHDGARPLASADLYSRMSAIDPDSDGAIPVVSLADSIRELTAEGSRSVDRSRYAAVQTPQTFRLGPLRRAYDVAGVERLTDDASVMEHAGHGRIALVEGEHTNIKVTNPLDLAIAEAIIKQQEARR